MSFRRILFWLHLAAGLISGLFIAIMCFTGAVITFEHEIVEWAERDVRRVSPPSADAKPLALDALVAAFREKHPDVQVTSLTLSADPLDAIAVPAGRDLGTYYLDPYTGNVRPPTTTATHNFMHLMEAWHRTLALTGDNRDLGRALTGASNFAFLLLGLSGLYLWWPKQLKWKHFRPALWFSGATGKARDWNWHNVYGFWFLPVLIVLTATGVVMSYRWANDLVYTLAGEEPPAAPGAMGGPATPAQPAFKIEAPEGAKRLTWSEAAAALQKEFPAWETISLREGLPARRGAPPANQGNTTPAQPERQRGPQPYSATVRESGSWPVFASTQMVMHPFDATFISRNGFSDQTTGRQARSWVRQLHTGAALGTAGKIVALLACLAGCLLVWTGFALAWRRWRAWRKAQA